MRNGVELFVLLQFEHVIYPSVVMVEEQLVCSHTPPPWCVRTVCVREPYINQSFMFVIVMVV